MSEERKLRRYPLLSLAFLGLAMTGVSIYLTEHYFSVHFPKSLSSGSFCDISRFWNCDSAAFSVFSNFFSVPTSLFGAYLGLIILFGAFFKKVTITGTNYFLALLNLLGCLFLFGYSLLYLGGLCPGCTIYYVLSLLLVVVFWRQKDLRPVPHFPLLLLYGAVALVVMASSILYNRERVKDQDAMFMSWVEEIHQARVFDDSALDFSFALERATPNFADAPLRITLFSDFQCPFCKILGHEIQKIAARYQGKLNVRYLFYPLDSKCNPQVNTEMHPHACAGARLSYCAKEQFVATHDDIYEHQTELNDQWFLNKSKELGYSACFLSEKSEKALELLIESTKPFEIDAAPTLLINGRKISGLIPAKALITLLDSFLLAQ